MLRMMSHAGVLRPQLTLITQIPQKKAALNDPRLSKNSTTLHYQQMIALERLKPLLLLNPMPSLIPN